MDAPRTWGEVRIPRSQRCCREGEDPVMGERRIQLWFERIGWKKGLSLIAGVVLALGGLYLVVLVKTTIDQAAVALTPQALPQIPQAKQRQFVGQGWSPEESTWFHHVSQGTMTLPIPYRWFMALEQPKSSPWLFGLGDEKLFSELEYLRRFGFIQGRSQVGNGSEDAPEHLPIGFATTPSLYFEGMGQTATAIGLTCAACHTGHLVYGDTEYIIEGGPALTDLGALTQVLGAALGQTLLSSELPFLGSRFARFAERVLGNNATTNNAVTRQRLKEQLTATIGLLGKQQDTIYVTEGFGRLDALNRIGNQVFAQDLRREINRVGIDAPVNYPHLWTTSWFDWVQYDGSIMQPLARNTGEALGVNAYLNLTAPAANETVRTPQSPPGAPANAARMVEATAMVSAASYAAQPRASAATERGGPASVAPPAQPVAGLLQYGQRFASSVPIENLYQMEQRLRGVDPVPKREFTGLTGPGWPSALGKIDAAKAEAGKQLYAQRCVGCHLPALSSPEIWAYMSPIQYQKDGKTLTTPGSYLRLPVIALTRIGTDPRQAGVLSKRVVDTTDLGLDTSICTVTPADPEQEAGDGGGLGFVTVTDSPALGFAAALGAAIQETNDQWFDQHYVPEAWRAIYDGERPNCLRAGAGYRARPLNGVWATAPFLHNGSVPTLEDLLSPVSERPRYVQLGNPAFDAKRVGLAQEGHVARLNAQRAASAPDYIDGFFILDTHKEGNWNTGHEFANDKRPGVIGAALDSGQRAALVEYLKTL
jgi:hypothetical protein